jgi:hypothetical protein
MKTKIIKKLITLICLVSFFLTLGCYNTYSIQPTEVPKLNNTYSVQVGSRNTSSYNSSTGSTKYSSSPIMAHSTRHVKRPDGRTAEITGKATIIITTKTSKYTFTHPTIASLNSGHLKIAGANRPEQIFMIGSIKKVEVEQYSHVKSLLAYVGISILLIYPLILFFDYVTKPDDTDYE